MTTLAAQQLRIYFSGPVEQRLATARQLHADHGPRLAADQDILTGLKQVRQFALELQEHMLDMDMASLCRRCAARTDGGCCSAYMADNSDAILLLINMLLEIPVQMQEESETECCFLGQTGCILPVKPIFCLNYNCHHIRNAAEKNTMRDMERLAGRLLSRQTELEGVLLERINRMVGG